VDDPVLSAAQERFGIDYLYPYQRLVIANILSAADSPEPSVDKNHTDTTSWGRQIVILPTGAGKSLCFQLPATVLPGPTLVIYPLLSLMNDQERRITEAGFSVVQLKGGQDGNERASVARELLEGVDFILTNPETLVGPAVRSLLKRAAPAHAVIDEAHCISEWGDTFREAYLTTGESIAAIGVPLVTAFTATASDHVIRRIREVLFPEGGAHLIRGNADRENITYSVVPCFSKRHAVVSLLTGSQYNWNDPAGHEHEHEHEPKRVPESVDDDTGFLPVFRPGETLPLPAIFFCRTRWETQFYASLAAAVVDRDHCYYYHAGLSREEKKRVEESFFRDDRGVLAATCAYGMGVDKKNIRAVVHTYIPATVEAFLQESGRGGRDRAPAYSITLTDPTDISVFQERLQTGTAGPVERAFFSRQCRRTTLLHHLGYRTDTCTGCDRCVFPDDESCSPAVELALSCVAETRQHLTRREWIAVWQGRLSVTTALAGHRGIPGYGMFTDWREDELEEGLENLLGLGVLKLSRNRVRRSVNPKAVPDRTDRPRPYLSFEIADC